jgi:hypothetical protein
MIVRDADPADLEQLTRIWHEGWHEAHARIVPIELTTLRTWESFRHRLEHMSARVRIADSGLEAVGLCITRGAELYQLLRPNRRFQWLDAQPAGMRRDGRSDFCGDRRRNQNRLEQPREEWEVIDFGQGDERARVRDDGHSERVAIGDLVAQLVTAELKVRNATR